MAEEPKDKPMGWETLIPLIVAYAPQGIELAQKIWQKWSTKTPPTDADFVELRAIASQTAADRMRLQLTKAGIPLDSPQAVALLAQVGA